VGGLLQASGSNQTTRQGNKNYQTAASFFTPWSVMNSAYYYNPWLFSAMSNQGGMPFNSAYSNRPDYMQYWNLFGNSGGGYAQQLRNIVQHPGYIDPTLMNRNYQQLQQGANATQQGTQAMLGRSGMQGSGVGNAYAFANQAARGQQRGQLGQQYGLWTEQQRRQDVDWIGRQINNAAQMGFQGNAQMAPYIAGQMPTMNWKTITGNAIQGGLGAFSGMGPGANGNMSMAGGTGSSQAANPTGPTPWGQQLFGGQNQNPFGR
jgi:hypothetical protein